MRVSELQFGRRWAASLAGLAVVVAACTTSGGGAGVYGGAATTAPAPSQAAASAAAASPAASAASGGGGRYGSGGDDYGTPASKPPTASAGAAGAPAIGVGNGTVGAYLTGEGGRTLYIFKKDAPLTSACEGDCATNWPPFTVDPTATVKAAAEATGIISLFARADGSTQVSYDGAPLYYFAGDSAAGDTSGQGVGDNWFVAAP